MSTAILGKPLPPGPRFPMNWEQFWHMRGSILGSFQSLHAQYGDIAAYQLAGQTICLVQRPDLVHRILVHDNAQFKKGRFLELAKDLLGEGLLTSEGEHHARQRRLIQPIFYRKMIQRYGTVMVKWSERFAQRWQAGEVLDMASTLQELTLAVVGEALFGVNIEQEAQDVGHAMETVLDLSIVSKPLRRMTRKWPLPLRKQFLQAKATLDRTIQEIIAAEPNPDPEQQSLVHILMAATDAEGKTMDSAQIRDEALTLLLAGHETTANALAWSLYLLSESPRVHHKLQQELQHMGSRMPQVDDLNQLNYTRQILTESMRLYPPAWILGRRVLNDYALGDYAIPADSLVMCSQYLSHRNPQYFSDPERFWPERWQNNFRQSLPKGVYYPFSLGPRNCVGEAFAWMEGILILASLCRHWRYTLIPDHPIDLHPQVTLRPRYGLKMRVEALA